MIYVGMMSHKNGHEVKPDFYNVGEENTSNRNQGTFYAQWI